MAPVTYNSTQDLLNETIKSDVSIGPLPIGLLVFMGIFMTLLSLLTVLGNLMVMMSFYVDKKIRQPANYYIFSLAISDLLIGLEGFPLYTLYTVQRQWLLGWFVCDLWLSIDYCVW